MEASAFGGRPFRILQKRGAIVDAEDFLPVTDTYPNHPLTESEPDRKTRTELLNYRKKGEQVDIGKKIADHAAKVTELQKVQFKDYHKPQEYVENPQYTAMWQKRAEERIKKRLENGLLAENTEPNLEKLPDPTIAWIENARTNLKEARKKELLKELQKVEGNLQSNQRGQVSEDFTLKMSVKALTSQPRNMQYLKEMRTKELIDDMTKKFGNQVLGVHGQELPKFAGHPND